MKFIATYVEPYTNSTTANVMFADPETDPDQPSVLSFSRPIEKGFEDSNYYFEINDQSYGSYGGLEFVRLSRNSIEVRLEQRIVEKFKEEDFQEVMVEFNVNDEVFESVRATLRRIFETFDVFQEL
ncbi:MAG: hypothetical protein JNM02_06035 [Anaerolineales bacterium]|nr:hypothetical protein [Anaerolineales bacterium]